jgi:hypothetical protein
MRIITSTLFTLLITTYPAAADALSDAALSAAANGCPSPVVYGLEAKKTVFAVLDNVKKVYVSAQISKSATLTNFKCENGVFYATIVHASDKVDCQYSAPIIANDVDGQGGAVCTINGGQPINVGSFEFHF